MAQLSAQSLREKALRDLSAKKFPQALKKAQRGVKSFPNAVEFHAIAGFALTEMERYQQSIPHFAEAVRIKPDDPQFAENLVNALMQTGQLDRALAMAERKLERFPDSGELARVVEEIVSKGTNWLEIISHVTKRLEADPDNARLLQMRARAYDEIDAAMEASRDITRAYQLAPENIGIAVQKAVERKEAGHSEECAAILWKVLERDSRHAEALYTLSTVVAADRVTELADRVEAVSAEAKQVDAAVQFAKAHLVARRDGLAGAMPYYARANAAQYRAHPFDRAREEDRLERVRAVFGTRKAPPVAQDENQPRPIFVIGQPRSGTTLMEVMLSAVPGVAGCGELLLGADLSRPVIDDGKTFDVAAADHFARAYRRMMPPLPDGATAFVDKMPHNYKRLGFLLSAFPNAKVINMLRDPRDVGVSMWITRFPAAGMRYTHDLESIAALANLYRLYMTHWESIFGPRILTVAYEDLVTDPEGQSRRVADFCDLSWTDRMLRPQDSTQFVRTASSGQVRRKITASSIGGWLAVESFVQPMLDGFDRVLWPEYNLSAGL